MNSPHPLRHRAAPARAGARTGGAEADPLAGLRQALQQRNPVAFAACFSADGWVRVPHPDGDFTFRGRDEITRAGYELRAVLVGAVGSGDPDGTVWTPSQRFVAAGQVVEEGVARVGEQQVPMRLVTASDPAGGIGSLTLWIDWAALHDPLGVLSAGGAASALVAQARARSQNRRGVRVFRAGPLSGRGPVETSGTTRPWPGPPRGGSEPASADRFAAVPGPPRVDAESGIPGGDRESGPLTGFGRSARPAAGVLWWRQHRGTVAGSLMAGLTVVVLGWLVHTVLESPVTTGRPARSSALAPARTGTGSGATGSGSAGSGSAGSGSAGSGSTRSGATDGSAPGSGSGATTTAGAGGATGASADGSPGARLPAITAPKTAAHPTVQAGTKIVLQSDVLFETGSTQLSPAARTRLRQIANTVLGSGITGTIQINGYTDDVGGAELNRALSQARATAVAVALRGDLAGSDVVSLVPQGFGESSPVRSNATAAGRQRNRRVTVVLPFR